MAPGRGPLGDLSGGRSRHEPTRSQGGPTLARTVAKLEWAHGSGRARVEREAHAGAVLRARALAARGRGTPGLLRGRGAVPGWMGRGRRRGWILRHRRCPCPDRVPRGEAAAKRRAGTGARPAIGRVRHGVRGGGSGADPRRRLGIERHAKPAPRARFASGGCRARAPGAGRIAGADRRGDRRSGGAVGDLGGPARLRRGYERLRRHGWSACRKRRAVRPEGGPLVKIDGSPRRPISAAESASSSPGIRRPSGAGRSRPRWGASVPGRRSRSTARCRRRERELRPRESEPKRRSRCRS